MQIIYLETVNSTQTYLKDRLQSKDLKAPIAVSSDIQTNGLGSRDNQWSGYEGNLFLSFALSLDSLPSDLKIESASIYFSYILKITLASLGSKVQIKWPNDFYVDNKKIGGMITNIVGKTLVCGVGVNLVNAPDDFSTLDIKIDKKILLQEYFKNLEKNFSWKQVFSKYELEFYTNNDKIYLIDATLQNDGSIINNNGERIYSRR